MKSRRLLSWGLAASVCLILLSQGAFAVVPVVKTVPVVASDPSVTHDTYAGKSITLKGTSSVQGSNFQADWDFGDGSAHAVFTIGDMYNVAATHVYAGSVGTTWTATLTVTDLNNPTDQGSATYKVTMRATNLQSQVNVAIDEGLWYLHKTQHRYTSGVNQQGDWTTCVPAGCVASDTYYGITATNVQAFEVNGHLETGPASDPYTETVARGLKDVFSHLTSGAIAASHQVQSNPLMSINIDGNGNGLAVYVNQSYPFYQGGMFIDAIIASGTPAAIAVTGPTNVVGRQYKDIVQDLVDGYANCQYTSGAGGGWRYNCGDFPDNSACQWAAIGIIGAVRTFGITVDPNLYKWNTTWLASSQASNGVFGYQNASPAWGPYATTPSGMVQLAMDGIGRGDTRWDHAETFMRDNFGNTGNSNTAVKMYYYGLFSFTKAMLLHAPGGVLTPITLLQSSTPGVTPIDWYAAEVTNGDPTDGVARTLVNAQSAGGYWQPPSTDINSGDQQRFQTGFAIIMLQRTVFIACVTNLYGRGTAKTAIAPARIDLTWSGIPSASSYDVLRGTATGGPYTKVGNSVSTAYSDRVGLTSGQTYYYVLQPIGASGAGVCQSNEAKVTIPNAR